LALFSSYTFDLPTGYTIIFVIVLSSLLFVTATTIRKSRNPKADNEK